jgi:DNA polymerase-1
MDQVETGLVCTYAAEDADYTWRLYELFEPQITGSHVASLFSETEVPLVAVLAEMEHNGIGLDCPLLRKLSNAMAERTAELSREICKAAGHAFNVDSTRQLAVVLFDEQNLPVIRKTKTGRSTDADTLKALASQSDNPIPRLVLEYRELAKLKSTYVDPLPRMICPRTGRLHAGFNQTGAVTGRLSSSDPNLQNIPIRTETGRQIRAAVVAGAPDSVLLTADYSQIELRLLAHFCQDEGLLAAFRAGQDIHRTVAAQVHGIPPDDVSSAQRSAAKAVNFGIIYGQSAFGLSRSLGIPVAEAQSFIDMYFLRYPGIRRFIDDCIACARSKGYAETILGRRRPIPELGSRNRQQVGLGERVAVNTVVQGSAADLIKRAMIEIHREIKSGDHSARMLIQVHDELVFEVPAMDVEREAAFVREKMEHAIPLNVPLVADVGWGPTWAEGK